jgi:hypothetical protein
VSETRQVEVAVNTDLAAQLSEELGLVRPCYVTIVHSEVSREDETGAKWETKGDFDPISREIRLMVNHTWLRGAKLSVVRSSIVRTLLHEFRHAMQYENPDWAQTLETDSQIHYGMQDSEADANEFAAQNCTRYANLIRLSLKRKSSYDFGHGPRGFAKLSEVSK